MTEASAEGCRLRPTVWRFFVASPLAELTEVFCSESCGERNSKHSSMPWPVFADRRKICIPGRTACMAVRAAFQSNSTASASSVLVTSATSAPLKIVGCFSGLSSPSVTDIYTRPRFSPDHRRTDSIARLQLGKSRFQEGRFSRTRTRTRNEAHHKHTCGSEFLAQSAAVRSPEVYRANLDAATLRFFHDSVHLCPSQSMGSRLRSPCRFYTPLLRRLRDAGFGRGF